MQYRYCWRCQFEAPMLGESEYGEVLELYRKCMREIPTGPTGGKDLMHEAMKPVRDAYERMTGWKDMHHNAVMHHRLSLLGLDCARCGKPLRTPQARFCAACGWDKGA